MCECVRCDILHNLMQIKMYASYERSYYFCFNVTDTQTTKMMTEFIESVLPIQYFIFIVHGCNIIYAHTYLGKYYLSITTNFMKIIDDKELCFY